MIKYGFMEITYNRKVMNIVKNLFISIHFYLYLNSIESRKYDIEAESLKLYGEDFNTILKRFRKTPQYLKILEVKVADLFTHKAMISTALNHYYIQNKLVKRIEDIFGIERGKSTSTTASAGRLGNYFKRNLRRGLRDLSTIKNLDNYYKLASPLTAAEINSFKDIGFEYAGHVIHGIIKHMTVPDDPGEKSTRLPFFTEEVKSFSTMHNSIHEVTTPTEIDDVKSTLMADTNLYRYRAESKKNNARDNQIS